MKKELLFRKSNLVVMGLFFSTISCDIVQKDASPSFKTQNIDMYVAADKAAVIDLQNVFPDFNKVDLGGNKSNVRYFNDRYVKYQSNSSNTDAFSFNVGMKSGPTVSAKVNVSNQGACSNGESFTGAQISNDSKLVVNLFNNSEFCDFDIFSSGNGVSIAENRAGDVNQNTDGLLIAICACGQEGNTAILTYVPPQGFVGKVKFKYYLGVYDGTKQLSGDDYYNPQAFKYFSAHDAEIDVVAK